MDVTSYLQDIRKKDAILKCLQDVETENHVKLYFHVLPPLDEEIICRYARFCGVCVSRAQQIYESLGVGSLDAHYVNRPGFELEVREEDPFIDPFIMETE